MAKYGEWGRGGLTAATYSLTPGVVKSTKIKTNVA